MIVKDYTLIKEYDRFDLYSFKGLYNECFLKGIKPGQEEDGRVEANKKSRLKHRGKKMQKHDAWSSFTI